MNIISKQYTCIQYYVLCRHMHVVRTIQDMRIYNKNNNHNKSIGFVPTMGALHQGHLSLMKKAKSENDLVYASVFVNPSQFSQGEDFDKYPRDLDQDLALLKSIGVDCVFAPDTTEMYQPNSLCHVEPKDFLQIYEGRARPEFFRGVATIVTKLFNIVQPSIAYFGQKDVSQCILICKLVEDLNIPVDIKVIETIRDVDGLALSSRNAYLSSSERSISNILYRGLSTGKEIIEKNSVNNDTKLSSREIVESISQIILSEPKVTRIEYISVASHINMKELDYVNVNTGAVISSAIRIGNVRLIDNVLVGRSNELIGKLSERKIQNV